MRANLIARTGAWNEAGMPSWDGTNSSPPAPMGLALPWKPFDKKNQAPGRRATHHFLRHYCPGMGRCGIVMWGSGLRAALSGPRGCSHTMLPLLQWAIHPGPEVPWWEPIDPRRIDESVFSLAFASWPLATIFHALSPLPRDREILPLMMRARWPSPASQKLAAGWRVAQWGGEFPLYNAMKPGKGHFLPTPTSVCLFTYACMYIHTQDSLSYTHIRMQAHTGMVLIDQNIKRESPITCLLADLFSARWFKSNSQKSSKFHAHVFLVPLSVRRTGSLSSWRKTILWPRTDKTTENIPSSKGYKHSPKHSTENARRNNQPIPESYSLFSWLNPWASSNFQTKIVVGDTGRQQAGLAKYVLLWLIVWNYHSRLPVIKL